MSRLELVTGPDSLVFYFLPSFMRMFTCTAQNIYQIGQSPIPLASDNERQFGHKRKKFFSYEKTTLKLEFGFYLRE